jgi:hypothetical protein
MTNPTTSSTVSSSSQARLSVLDAQRSHPVDIQPRIRSVIAPDHDHSEAPEVLGYVVTFYASEFLTTSTKMGVQEFTHETMFESYSAAVRFADKIRGHVKINAKHWLIDREALKKYVFGNAWDKRAKHWYLVVAEQEPGDGSVNKVTASGEIVEIEPKAAELTGRRNSSQRVVLRVRKQHRNNSSRKQRYSIENATSL